MMFRLSHLGFLAGVLLAGCESPKERAMEKLRERGTAADGVAVMRAVQDHDDELLEALLLVGAYPGQRDERGNSPLHLAIGSGCLESAWLLVEAGAEIDAEAPGGVTPLAMALVGGQSALADRLLDRGADPDKGLTPDGQRLLPWAIRHGRLAFVRRLLAHGADPHQTDRRGTPLLHVAMDAGRQDLMRELIERGADCGAVNAEGESVLVLALRNGWRDQVGPLVRRGADPNRPDREGMTPFDRALAEGDLGLARELVELSAGSGGKVLHEGLAEAFKARDFRRCGDLLKLGARPSPPGAPSLLERCVEENEAAFLHLFLSYEPVPDGLLFRCCRDGRGHLAGLLLAHGANPNPARAPYLEVPFGAAMHSASDELASRLLERGALPDIRTGYGQSPLAVAVALRRPRTAELLLKHGADPNAHLETPAGRSYVDLARGSLMRWLLLKDDRITPVMVAADGGSLETMKALLDHGGRKHVWTRRNSIWPINIAARQSDVKMMRLLLDKDPYVEERQIRISLSEQRLRVFGKSGEEIFETRVSTGKKGYGTPAGTYAITNRYRDWTSTLYHASMPYFQRLSCGDFGFHQGYVPNHPASHGCIRVPAGKASKLFQLTQLGDRVTIEP